MNVEDVLIQNDVQYLSKGKDYVVKCLNPEHEDANPSMRIDKISGIFHCFSCHFKGNIFEHFGEALSLNDQLTSKLKTKIRDILGEVVLKLPNDAVFWEQEYRGISASTMQAFSAFTTNEVEGMTDRIVFPIRNLYGDTKAFVGRWIHSNADPKYLNYPSGITLPLYPSDPYILHDSIILVEGILDALNLIDKGLPNAVCAFGAHTLSERNIDKILYFHILGVKKIYIMFDADETGKKASLKLEKALKPHFAVEIVELPDGRDPGSLDKKEVEFIWKHLYENSRSRKNTN